MACGPDELWRAPYGVEISSVHGAAGSEPWSVLMRRPWPLFPARGLEGWLQWAPQGEKRELRSKNGLETEGRCHTITHCPNLDPGHSDVFRGLHWVLQMETKREKNARLALPHSATAPRLHL